MLLIATVGLVQSSFEGPCVHAPNKSKIMKKLYKEIVQKYMLGYTSYNVIPEYRNVVRKHYASLQSNTVYDELKSRDTYIYGSSVCPRSRRLVQTPVKSTCPHYIVLNVDKQREPRSIAKVKCSCHRCLRIDTAENRHKSTSRCKPVSTFVPVIRWKCPKPFARSDNYFKYVIDLEEVPVGCTCERAKPAKK